MTSGVVTAGVAATAESVASAARLIARAGLVEAFGHVSARVGEMMLITSTAPLEAAQAAGIHRIPVAPGHDPEGDAAVPLEWPLHAAVYRARPDLGAICRTHSAAAVAVGATGGTPRLLHGLGGLAGDISPSAESIDLVTAEPAADLLAAELGGADCLILRANGAVATGASLERAVVRAWFLEERCRVALAAGTEAEEIAEPAAIERARWYPKEIERAWRWLEWRFGDAGRTRPGDSKGASAPERER